MDVFIGSLFQVLQWPTSGYMLLGIAIGFVVGILPGVGGGVTMVLMLPFVFGMEPVTAFAFLLGMHAVVATTGDITSVLFGIPGEATSMATVLDGYPMTQRGEAGRALGAVLFSSLYGALVGAFFLAISVPVIRPIVLSFGAPEFLMLTLLGLCFLIGLSSENIPKGLVMAGLGFWLSLIGLDPQAGIPRYTFEQLYLWEGLNIIPVAVGLFGIPEILELMHSKASIAKNGHQRLVGALAGVVDTLRYWWLTLRCSLIGVFIGIIPGMGGTVAQFIAYSHAQQTSRRPEEFGKGSIEGVLAAGSVNNSKEGGSIIPTVAFGIPGSVSTAILLSAFLITGLRPGPDMLTKDLNVTYSMVWVIALSNVVAVGVSFLFLGQLAAVTYIQGRLLVPSLLLFITIGAFTANNSLNDVVVMLLFGAVGVVANRYKWPIAPLLLALVLGKTTERYLFLSNSLYGWSWLGHPLVIILALVAIGGVVLPSLHLMRRRRAIQVPSDDAPHTSGSASIVDIIIALALSGLAVWSIAEARAWPFRASLFPVLVSALIAMVASFVVVQALRRRRADAAPIAGTPPASDTGAGRRRLVQTLAWFVAFFGLTWLLGLVATAALFSVSYLRVMARCSWPASLVGATAHAAFVYVLFDRLLHVPLPAGIIVGGLPI